MKVTVCQLDNDMRVLEEMWPSLKAHAAAQQSDLLLLPEMPFHTWLADSPNANPDQWAHAVASHDRWVARFTELPDLTVAGTRPIIEDGQPYNEAFLWDAVSGYRPIHRKYYLPDEEFFWEATWCRRGEGDFLAVESPVGKIGFLICTEMWFTRHARDYAEAGVQLLLVPRATLMENVQKWIVGGRAAAVVSGAYCLSSNIAGSSPLGAEYGANGWIIEPEAGEILGVTTPDQPFLTIDISLDNADAAKRTYPRYVKT